MAWMPGVIKKEISKHRNSLRRVRGVCLHVAVSEGSSLYNFFKGAAVCSHFYVRKDGTIEQYVDTRYQAPANLQGNTSLISVETQGGVKSANSEPWTSAQVEALARIAAWASKTHGFPLIPMPNSWPSSVGVGYHRQGVDPYRVVGGEKWSNSYGKICPGQGKINQIRSIVERAKEIAAGSGGLPDTGEDEDMPTAKEVADEIFSDERFITQIRRAVWESPISGVKGQPSYFSAILNALSDLPGKVWSKRLTLSPVAESTLGPNSARSAQAIVGYAAIGGVGGADLSASSEKES